MPKHHILYLMYQAPVNSSTERLRNFSKTLFTASSFSAICLLTSAFIFPACSMNDNTAAAAGKESKTIVTDKNRPDTVENPAAPSTIDTALYNKLSMRLANGDTSGRWPVKAPYPKPGAILPFNRIVSYYGNLYSTRMGILGELPPQQMLEKLKGEVKKWQKADTTIKVIPALHYIAVTAQGSPGKGNTYRLRMPFKQIDSILGMARKIDALVFLDVQVGLSNLQAEIPELEKYLMMPNVHLGIDPEFSMKGGQAPGKVVGSFDAADINYASEYLAKLVNQYNLPPKVLIVHRFTQNMVKGHKQIKTRPEVQIVMDMDGWGAKARKINTYRLFVSKEPVQFTGFKIFYKNDLKETDKVIFSPEEVLKLKPQPIYIQYQ
jgi:hypothetical protein